MTWAGQAVLRRGRHDDWPGAEALLREVDDLHAALAPSFFRSGPRAELEWRRLLSDPNAVAVVAVEQNPAGPLVGMVAARVYDTPAEPAMLPRRRAHVETLVVAARCRRRGIGRRLLIAAGDWARARGAVEIVLTAWEGNEAADAFYQRLGYRVLSRVLHTPL
ncbi:MAG TPA: GNAT family N-acetyltransferase [Polyangia bacterium]|nr:GNAT family N-acetyltransferase [Polyangia bacterium]